MYGLTKLDKLASLAEDPQQIPCPRRLVGCTSQAGKMARQRRDGNPLQSHNRGREKAVTGDSFGVCVDLFESS